MGNESTKLCRESWGRQGFTRASANTTLYYCACFTQLILTGRDSIKTWSIKAWCDNRWYNLPENQDEAPAFTNTQGGRRVKDDRKYERWNSVANCWQHHLEKSPEAFRWGQTRLQWGIFLSQILWDGDGEIFSQIIVNSQQRQHIFEVKKKCKRRQRIKRTTSILPRSNKLFTYSSVERPDSECKSENKAQTNYSNIYRLHYREKFQSGGVA